MMIGHVRWRLGIAGIAAALAMGAPVAAASAAPATVPAAEHTAAAIDWGWPGTWQQGASYDVGDVVSYGGLEYRCIQAHTAYAPDWTPPQTPALWQQL